MSLKITYYGNPILRKTLKKVDPTDPEVHKLIIEMIPVMYDDDGIGLTANQVGKDKRLFVIGKDAFEDGRSDSAFINAEILASSDEEVGYEEGCLSVPGIRETVSRPAEIKVKYQDMLGNEHEETFGGFAARVFQHEYDHSNGLFFVDRISPIRRSLIKKKLKKITEEHA